MSDVVRKRPTAIISFTCHRIRIRIDISVVVLVDLCFGVEYMCAVCTLCTCSYFYKFGKLSGRLMRITCSCLLSVPDCQFSFFHISVFGVGISF